MDERDMTLDVAAAEPDAPDDDDVVGHRFLTPDQAQARADRARDERAGRSATEPLPDATDDQT